MLRRGFVCYAVVAACGLAAAPAALAGSWGAQKMVVPQAATGQFNSVSCVTGQCIGVGGAINSAGQGVSLAEKRTTGSWSTMTVPDPSGNFATELDSISCTTASACTALGYSNATSTGNFSQTWNGSSWSSPAFIPADSSGFPPDLSQISCWTAGSCVAVGTVGTSTGPPYQVPAAAVLSGGIWKVYALSNPVSGAVDDYLVGISCPASGSGKCMAVGYGQTYSELVPFTELLTTSGGSLSSSTSKATVPPSAYNGYAWLNAISCTSTSACIAVGFGDGASSAGNYATSWNGTAWSSPATVATVNGSELSSISCVASTSPACVAVGSEEANHLSGTSSSELTPPADVFAAVSCTSSTSCMAAGSKPSVFGGPAATRKPPVGPATRLAAQRRALTQLRTTLAHPTGTRSAAVNAWRAAEVSTPPAGQTAAALWSGGTTSSAWTAQTTVSPPGAQYSSVQRISCAGGKCLAVGGAGEDYSITAPLAESGPGTWAIQSKVGSISGAESYLSDVSCFLNVSATECIVLGQNETTGSSFSQLATAGSPWTVGTPASFATPSSALPGSVFMQRISCRSPSACTAVGFDTNANSLAQAPLVEKWNGSSWTAQATPGGSSLNNVILNAVSCASTSACNAVGTVLGSANDLAFGEGWAGTTWSMQTMTFPSTAAGSDLFDVSCPVTGTCTAVGIWNNSSGSNPLAERLASGKWAPQSFTAFTTSASTQAVSCVDSSDCMSVGNGSAAAWTTSGWGAPATLPVPSGEYFGPNMSGVYCSGASACTAAGNVQSYVLVPLAEAYS